MEKEQIEKDLLGYEKVFEEGFYIYGWDLEWNYGELRVNLLKLLEVVNAMEYMLLKNRSSVKNKIVLLMHDKMFATQSNGKENLQILITLLKNKGWKFENIEQYL